MADTKTKTDPMAKENHEATAMARRNYRELLRRMREERDGTPITNRYPWQSRYAICELLCMAADGPGGTEIKLITGTATDKFFGGDVAEALYDSLDHGCPFRAIVWNDTEKGFGKALGRVSKLYPNLAKVKMSGTRKFYANIRHFLLVGNSAYRLEAQHDPLDDVTFTDVEPETPARISFSDAAGGQNLAEYFADLWEICPLSTAGAGPQSKRG